MATRLPGFLAESGLQAVSGHCGSLMVEEWKWEESKLLVSKEGTKLVMQYLYMETAEVPKCNECCSASSFFPKLRITALKRDEMSPKDSSEVSRLIRRQLISSAADSK